MTAGRPASAPQPPPDQGLLEAVGISRERAVLAARVGELRFAQGWTQSQLAHRSEISQTIIKGIEAGKRNVQLSTMMKLVNVFRLCWVDELFVDVPTRILRHHGERLDPKPLARTG